MLGMVEGQRAMAEGPDGDGERSQARLARERQVLSLRTELAALEWRARRLGLEEVAHFAGVAAAAASELIRRKTRKPAQR